MKNCWALRRKNRKASRPAVPSFVRLRPFFSQNFDASFIGKKRSKKGSTVKAPSMFRHGNEDFTFRSFLRFLHQLARVVQSRGSCVCATSPRFGAAGQSARQCLLEVLEARRAACEDFGLDAAENAVDGTCGNASTLFVNCGGGHVPSTVPGAPKKHDKSILSWCGHG